MSPFFHTVSPKFPCMYLTVMRSAKNLYPGYVRLMGLSLVEVMNITGRRNAQLVNPITGRAYEYGDDVPLTWRDPRPEFNGPQETGTDPRNPARYSAPTQLLAGIQIKW